MTKRALYVIGFILLSGLAGYLLLGYVGLAPLGVGRAPPAPGLEEVPQGGVKAARGAGLLVTPEVGEAAYGGAGVPAPTAPPATYPVTSAGGAEIPTSAYAGRSLIIRVEVGVEVPEGQVGQAASAVERVAVSKGGWVEYSMVTDEYATVTVRVPVESLDAALAEIRQIGTVKSETRSATDVTDQLVDLDARLRNAKAEEQRLLEILSKAETVNEILQVEDRLSHVRERIERLEAQKKMLEEQVDYATVTVTISVPEPEPPEEPLLPGFSLRDLVRAALKALVLALTLIIVGAAFLAPIVVVGWAILTVYRRSKGVLGQVPQSGSGPSQALAPEGG